MIGYAYVLATIGLIAFAQMMLKWRVSLHGALPADWLERVAFLLKLVLDPFIFAGLAAAFVASLAWMAALTHLELSRAYPMMSLSFAVVLVLSVWLLGEPLTLAKAGGIALIVLGTVVIGYGR